MKLHLLWTAPYLAAAAFGGPALAQSPADFYKGNTVTLLVGFTLAMVPCLSTASGSSGSGGSGSGGGGSTSGVDRITVSKCYYDPPTGAMLIKASSSDSSAQLGAYLPSGAYLGYVQNGGGSRYGGTVMPNVPVDPGNITIKSSSGGTLTVPTTPFII